MESQSLSEEGDACLFPIGWLYQAQFSNLCQDRDHIGIFLRRTPDSSSCHIYTERQPPRSIQRSHVRSRVGYRTGDGCLRSVLRLHAVRMSATLCVYRQLCQELHLVHILRVLPERREVSENEDHVLLPLRISIHCLARRLFSPLLRRTCVGNKTRKNSLLHP